MSEIGLNIIVYLNRDFNLNLSSCKHTDNYTIQTHYKDRINPLLLFCDILTAGTAGFTAIFTQQAN